MSYIVIDTETTGLPVTKSFNNFYDPKDVERYNASRIVQISWNIYDSDNEELSSKNYYIRPDNFRVMNSEFHGITESMLEDDGVEISVALNDLYDDLVTVEKIVAHNLNFDMHIIQSECYRYNLDHISEKLDGMNAYCTMLESINILKIPMKYRGYKFPSLSELYTHYFDTAFEGAHNSKYDVLACAKCYAKLVS
jgi:DNA polymerase III epsilon subunit-like protein